MKMLLTIKLNQPTGLKRNIIEYYEDFDSEDEFYEDSENREVKNVENHRNLEE